jgi:hypothetical protein
MANVSLTGNDVIKINGRLLSDLADADAGALTFPNNLVEVKTGKNGNSIYAFNETGRQCEVVLRLIRGSPDDRYLNGQLAVMKSDFAATILLTGEFVKRVGDGAGDIRDDTYILSGGIITKEVEVKTNAEGDTEQSITIYNMKFTNAPRTIG